MDDLDDGPPEPDGRRGRTLAERVAAREARHAEQELRDRQRAEDDATLAAHARPRTRADCADGPRPCVWVGCRHNLYLEVSERTGSIKIASDHAPEELEHSCALDLADEGGMTLEAVAAALNVTRQRVQQLEARGLALLRHARRRLGE